MWFRILPSGNGYDTSLYVSMSLSQGLMRKISFGDIDPLPLEFSEFGQWSWTPDAAGPYRDRLSSDIWRDFTEPGVGEAIEELASTEWFPVMDQLIRPGVISAELQKPVSQLPGKFTPRSEVNIALSLLNDGNLSEQRKEELVRVVTEGRPIIADRILRIFHRSQ